jgi:hypothetical protein
MKWLPRLALLAVVAAFGACNDSSGGGPAAVTPSEPGAPPVSILAKGGNGLGYDDVNDRPGGGQGGRVEIWNSDGTGIHMLKSGAVNLPLAIPDVVPDLGSNPRTIDKDTAITPSYDGILDNGSIVGDDGMTPATGLWVKPGATLTLNANRDEYPYYPGWEDSYGYLYNSVELRLSTALYVEGTIKVGRQVYIPYYWVGGYTYGTQTLDDACELVVMATNIVVASTGAIDARGADDSMTDLDEIGGRGGRLVLHGYGTIINKGTIDTSGGAGFDGGEPGLAHVFSLEYGVFNAGTIRANGGNGSGDHGANADFDDTEVTILLSGGHFGPVNTGTLTARGGNGVDQGGRGGNVVLVTDFFGFNGYAPYEFVASTGTIDVSGGNSFNGHRVRSGGAGGEIYLTGDVFRVSGELIARGGACGIDSRYGSIMGVGGRGGSVTIGSRFSEGPSPTKPAGDKALMGPAIPEEPPANPYGDSAVGANIDVSGGDGPVGHVAGEVYIETFLSAAVVGPCSELYLVNYDRIDVSGGDEHVNNSTNLNAGNGGTIVVMNSNTYRLPDLERHVGLVENEVSLIARGGLNATDSGNGGYGGAVALHSACDFLGCSLNNSGLIDASGGDGQYGGGDAGSLDFDGDSVALICAGPITNSGEIVASGGSGYMYNAGNCGNGGALYLRGDSVNNTGNLTANGGNNVNKNGGSGGYIELTAYAEKTATSGNLNARGGDGRNGGYGGTILISSDAPPSTVGGTQSVAGGVGNPGTNGTDGTIMIDP